MLTLIVRLFETPEPVAVNVAVVPPDDNTPEFSVNVAELDPEGTRTEGGADNGDGAVSEKDSEAEAEFESVNRQVALEAVPIVGVAPTIGKLQVTDERDTTGTTVTEAVWDTPLYDAVITADLLLVTEVVLAVKVAEEEPAGIVAVAGTVTAALLE